MTSARLAALLVTFAATVSAAPAPARLTHRVWLLAGAPEAGSLAVLRAAGVNSLVVAVGDAEVSSKATRLTLTLPGDVASLAGWPTSVLVWVRGEGRDEGDAASLLAQLQPVRRMLPGSGTLVLAAPRFWEGLPRFAAALAERSPGGVELAANAGDLIAHVPKGGWKGISLVAVVFGDAQVLGFPASTVQDDLSSLAMLDKLDVAWRAAITVVPKVTPAPHAPAALAAIAREDVASYRPGDRGDIFTMRRPLSWGGLQLEVGQSVTVEAEDTARYDRDIGMVLRPVRRNLTGWDTVGMPAPEPTFGMSLEAFADYYQGGVPHPTPKVVVGGLGTSVVDVSLANPSPYGSALATTGNWVELRFAGSEVRDVQLGEFSGIEYGRLVDGVWRNTIAREATIVRLYVTYLAPRATVSGGKVAFIARPRSISTRWGLRLGDGSEVAGPLEPAVTTP